MLMIENSERNALLKLLQMYSTVQYMDQDITSELNNIKLALMKSANDE